MQKITIIATTIPLWGCHPVRAVATTMSSGAVTSTAAIVMAIVLRNVIRL
jgi:hypothetical protein